MTVKEKPYWMSKPNKAVRERLERIRKVPSNSRLDGLELRDLEREIKNIVLQHIDIERYERIKQIESEEKEELRKYKLVLQEKDNV